MKTKFLLALLSFICLMGVMPTQAQNKKRATLEVILSDSSPLQISINGRLYKTVNRKLVIRDIPARNNDVEIIKKCNRSADPECKDQIVFSGKVRFEKGVNYQAVALVGEGKLRVSDQNDLIDQATTTNQVATNTKIEATTEFQHLSQIKDNLPEDITSLGTRMKKLNKDDQRVNAATGFVKARDEKVNSEQLLAISSWIMYDENKLQFLKNAYPYVSDPENYGNLQLAFTMNDAKQNFQTFINNN